MIISGSSGLKSQVQAIHGDNKKAHIFGRLARWQGKYNILL